MTDNKPRCGWDTGTVYTGPARCEKPAKYSTDNPSTNNKLVCGIHARPAVRRYDQAGDFYTVNPL
ncbi:MAG TPA: hypothetical protein VI172_08190 [Candidatus Dormibacteraeota bacterium]|jgi:hypothetical protein